MTTKDTILHALREDFKRQAHEYTAYFDADSPDDLRVYDGPIDLSALAEAVERALELPVFVSTGRYEIPHLDGVDYTTTLDRDCGDFRHILLKTVLLDGVPVTVKSVDWHPVGGMKRAGTEIGLVVSKEDAARVDAVKRALNPPGRKVYAKTAGEEFGDPWLLIEEKCGGIWPAIGRLWAYFVDASGAPVFCREDQMAAAALEKRSVLFPIPIQNIYKMWLENGSVYASTSAGEFVIEDRVAVSPELQPPPEEPRDPLGEKAVEKAWGKLRMDNDDCVHRWARTPPPSAGLRCDQCGAFLSEVDLARNGYRFRDGELRKIRS